MLDCFVLSGKSLYLCNDLIAEPRPCLKDRVSHLRGGSSNLIRGLWLSVRENSLSKFVVNVYGKFGSDRWTPECG